MSCRKSCVLRLEASQRRKPPPDHFLSVVRYPSAETAQERWRCALTCACGVMGCPALTIGLLVPEKAPSAEA